MKQLSHVFSAQIASHWNVLSEKMRRNS